MNIIRSSFLYIDKYSSGRIWTYLESTIPYNMLCYVIDGSAEFVVDGETVIMKKGQVSYIPEGCWPSCKALEDAFAFYSIRFTTSMFYEGASFLRGYCNFPLVVGVGEGVEPYFSDTYKRMHTDKKSRSSHVRRALDTLVASLIDILNSDEPGDTKAEISGLEHNLEQIRKRVRKSTIQTDPRIQTIIDYIMLNPIEEYTSDKLNGMAEIAETTFRCLFEETAGKTATGFVRQVRLTTAARLLLISNDPVNCIAHDVGFRDASHFTRVFRQVFGMTPGRYREMSQEQG